MVHVPHVEREALLPGDRVPTFTGVQVVSRIFEWNVAV